MFKITILLLIFYLNNDIWLPNIVTYKSYSQKVGRISLKNKEKKLGQKNNVIFILYFFKDKATNTLKKI